MQEDAALVTREQYIDMLIDASFREASERELGFLSWCERHVPIWRKLGHDETWIRQRIEMAQRTQGLHRTLKQQGLTMLEIREELRKMYADAPELYDLARARERHRPGLLRYRGNTGDLRPTRRSCRTTPPRRKKGRIVAETPSERSRANCAREPDHETDPGVCRHHPLFRWPEEMTPLASST
jgi:hypothetical protein